MRLVYTLTGHEGNGHHLIVPLVSDLYCLDGFGLVRFSGPNLIGMSDDLLHVVSHCGGHDVEEVRPVRQAPLRELGGKVAHELWVALHLGPHVLHRDLVVHGHVDALDLVELHQRLRPGEHFLQEVLVPMKYRDRTNGKLTSCTLAGGRAGGCPGSSG